MPKVSTSKYLQLPSADSTDLGKPSPLAMLAATCRKIGTTSPCLTARRVVRSPSPQPVSTPVMPPVACTPSYQLPPSPPPSPPPATGTPTATSPSDVTSLSFTEPSRVGPITSPQPCSLAFYRPQVSRYSPYTVMPAMPRVAPPMPGYHTATTHFSPYLAVGAVMPPILTGACSCCCSPYSTHHQGPYNYDSMLPQHVAATHEFGFYPHHSQPAASSSSLSRRSSHQEAEEEIIDVVSL